MIPLCDRVNDFKMEEIAFSDWPGQPVDLNSGNNPWLPAYGFQTPSALLEKEDFIGNPDAEYFLQGNVGQYMYLETIQEETSDDLRSESDIESRGSPVGWLATDSEAGSVICIDATDELDCESDREVACPAKRRKQDNFLSLPTSDDEGQSLSRSSSLLQFETLEKQCQETNSSSPSIYSTFSFDSLETNRKNNVSPDSLDQSKSDNEEDEIDYFKCLKIDVPLKKDFSRDSLLYNVTRSGESSDSDETLAARSFDNLRTWRSFDSLQVSTQKNNKEKASVENLSEDSGYSDNLTKSTSASNLQKQKVVMSKTSMKTKSSYVGFTAYDGDVFQNFQGNFGVSYQDLSNFEPEISRSPLIDRFIRNKRSNATNTSTKITNIESTVVGQSKNNCDSAPNLLLHIANSVVNQSVYVSSVPKDLNLIGQFEHNCDSAQSIAVKNFNLADLASESLYCNELVSETKGEMASFRREGSYEQAMANRVDLSDDEHGLCYRQKLPKTTIVEFDKQVLKAISETSIQSLQSSTNLAVVEPETILTSTPKRNVVSTPNLALMHPFLDEDHRRSIQDIRRKSSLIKSSTSTSGMSDFDEKTLISDKSFGSSNSKGVHFSPVVSEVNWHDDSVSTATPERESSYSLTSTPEREATPPTPNLVRPKARFASSPVLARGRSVSQPDLSDNENVKEFVDSLRSLRTDLSKSQPDVSRLKRRGSQLIKKDKDGCIIKAYVDGDGIQYKHTHLDLDNIHSAKSPTHATGGSAADVNSGGSHHSHSGGNITENNNRRQVKPVDAMEAPDAHRKNATGAGGKSRSGKIGGFFSRLASFRFSARKGNEEKNKINKKKNADKNLTSANIQPHQRIATKEDYIYIPLKSPTKESASTSPPPGSNNNHLATSNSMSGKPPLPKQPPRVVHASVKKDTSTPASALDGEPRHRHRRRTIDSGPPMEPMGLIETDLDTEVTVITSGAHVKTRSLLNLGAEPRLALATSAEEKRHPARPHKSMEFLLDKQNLKVVEPPENELQKGERVMSEHQLRVQRSLQKLTIPDWYKSSHVPREGFLLKKHTPRESRWTGTSSKTTSLSSLTSNSPVILSPTPTTQPFVRWSTSKLNSTASSPCASTRSSFNARQPNGSISPSSVRSSFSYRQPYLGWRSQERLSRPRTPAERLASSILSQTSHTPQPQESPEIQTSIKEVTSAIVHYVSGLKPEDAREFNYDSHETASQRSSSVSPKSNKKKLWLESSFVGIKPLDTPQTPVTLSESQSVTPVPPMNLRLELQSHNDVALLTAGALANKPSPSSTTLEDVLDSLLGLPSTGRAPSPSLQGRRPVDGVS